MSISNDHASFDLWQKENLVKEKPQSIMKMVEARTLLELSRN